VKRKTKRLKETVDRLKCSQRLTGSMALGQFAQMLFEEFFARNNVSEKFDFSKGFNVKSIVEFLGRHSQSSALEDLLELEKALGGETRHYRKLDTVVKALKDLRNPIAHPQDIGVRDLRTCLGLWRDDERLRDVYSEVVKLIDIYEEWKAHSTNR